MSAPAAATYRVGKVEHGYTLAGAPESPRDMLAELRDAEAIGLDVARFGPEGQVLGDHVGRRPLGQRLRLCLRRV